MDKSLIEEFRTKKQRVDEIEATIQEKQKEGKLLGFGQLKEDLFKAKRDLDTAADNIANQGVSKKE
ncbi:MAG: hypothetical protein ABI758_00900 [Candidatus Woesebacteria bacterium]